MCLPLTDEPSTSIRWNSPHPPERFSSHSWRPRCCATSSQHRNENVSRKQILEEVWGLHEDTDTRAIDNFIVRLRRYIEDSPGTPKYLITVRSIGYRFLPEQTI